MKKAFKKIDKNLKTLSVGEHTLKVAFSDNGEAITKFTIKEKQQGTNIEDNENTKKPFETAVANKWMPVDLYIGGLEHGN